MNIPQLLERANITESASRYQPVVETIGRLTNPLVLEVGPADSGVARYLGDTPAQLIYTDMLETFGGDSTAPRVRSSIDALPFRDNAFPVVACMDVMEHLPRPIRAQAINNLYRVTAPGGTLFISSPVGEAATNADQWLHDQLLSSGENPHRWVSEHMEHGVPHADDYLDWFKQAGIKPAEVSVKNDLSVTAWKHALEVVMPGKRGKPQRALSLAKFIVAKQRTSADADTYRKIYTITKA